MAKHFWILTRPKRKLIIVPELLKVFSAVAVGKKWYSNRELQREFEKKLVDFQWKAQNLSRDGSGSRTYAALLSMLGLWYEEDERVKLTQAGKEIVSGESPVPVLTKQLINFQYPSPYSKKVGIEELYKIHPHRFIISLMADERVNYLTQEELAFCVVPFAEKNTDLESCIERILSFRGGGKAEIINEAQIISKTSDSNLTNIANTFINQLEYTGFFKYRDENNAPFEFESGGKAGAQDFIAKYGRGIATGEEDVAVFQSRYGSGINTAKDYSNTNPVPPEINPNDRVILLTFYEIAHKRPIFGISNELITEVSRKAGINPKEVARVLTKIANQPLLDRFEEEYIILSKGGTDTATDFEVVTTNVFSEHGFGIEAEWVGSRGAYPDIFVYLDKVNKKHGIVDTKAYESYTLPLDHRNKMAHTYIPRFSEVEYQGSTYELEFFTYIAGGFGVNIQSSFDKLLAERNSISGSYITSYNFMQLLRRHNANPFSVDEFKNIFMCNKEVNSDEVAVARV